MTDKMTDAERDAALDELRRHMQALPVSHPQRWFTALDQLRAESAEMSKRPSTETLQAWVKNLRAAMRDNGLDRHPAYFASSFGAVAAGVEPWLWVLPCGEIGKP